MLRPALPCLTALLLAGCAAQGTTDAEPALELTSRVVDEADILSVSFEREMTGRLETLEKDTQVQMVIVTSPDLGGDDIADYTRDLANAWGIGDAERDDGLVLLVAPNERKVRIEVGYGLEASVTNEEAGEIIQTLILPRFRTGDFEIGVDAGVESLIQEVTPVEMKEAA